MKPSSKPSSSSNAVEQKNKNIVPLTPNYPTNQKSSFQVVQNRFSPLYQEIPTYSDLVQRRVILPNTPTKSEKFVSLGSSKFAKTQNAPQEKSNSGYISNPREQLVKILEREEMNLLKESFSKLIEFSFPGNSLYVGNKPREYYEAILEDTGSFRITHNKNPKQNSSFQVDFSKVQILKVLSLSDWGLRPFMNKALSNYSKIPAYNYYDYQNAWFNVFYLRGYSHSWFIFFDKTFDFNHGYPEWLITWFSYLGNITQTLPIQINDGFLKFQELFSQKISVNEYFLQFTILFKIPWIITWKFSIKKEEDTSSTFLYRTINVKWWNNLPKEQGMKMTIQGVINYFNQTQKIEAQPSVQNIPIQQFSKEEEDEFQRLMKAPTQEEMRRLYQEIKKGASGSSKSDDDQTVNLEDAQNPYDDFSPFD